MVTVVISENQLNMEKQFALVYTIQHLQDIVINPHLKNFRTIQYLKCIAYVCCRPNTKILSWVCSAFPEENTIEIQGLISHRSLTEQTKRETQSRVSFTQLLNGYI